MGSNKRVHLLISGRVQGVCFRAECQEMAKALGLKGWVMNRSDGCVETVAEGSEEKLALFDKWCRHGPPMARVDNVQINWTESTGEFNDFRITRNN